MITKYKPFHNVATGDFIREEMEIRGWTQRDLSAVLGISEKSISKLIGNKQAVTIKTASLLGKAFGQSPDYWLNLYNNYALRLLEDSWEENRAVETKALIYNNMPIGEMFKKGWMEKTRDAGKLVKEVLKFFNRKKLDLSLFDNANLPAFRKSKTYENFSPNYAFTWFQMAKNCAKHYHVDDYNRDALREIAKNLHAYTVSRDGVQLFIRQLTDVGVKFFVLSHLHKTYIDGASFFDGKNPVIVYTGRHDRIDNFWFTVAHEIAHILKHLRNENDFFIDDTDKRNAEFQNKQEKEADEFALETIKEREIIKFCTSSRYKTHSLIARCERELKICSGIIVGVLQHRKMLSRKNLNKYKYQASELLPENCFVERLLSL
ncbi:MAG: ImmA/IrrE family metallo-endopeptidase [Candidatus Eremiobacteraeota bacterium]|nr:ImmA/IrrE family metallo-endopeptidase [Candidatus Eremiobacteraeota bacterium]